MQDNENLLEDFLFIKVVPAGTKEVIELNEYNRSLKFKEILFPIFKKYKIKKRDAFLTTEDGKMLSPLYYSQDTNSVVNKFGNVLKLYNEKQI